MGQAQPVPVRQAYWKRLCLSQWDKQAGCTKPDPLGLGEVKRDLSLCHGTSHIPTMEAFPGAMAQALYHDGACTCSTCANLCHKVGLQGREIYGHCSQCPYKFSSFLDLRNASNRFRLFSRDFRLYGFFYPGSACFSSLAFLPSLLKYYRKFRQEFRWIAVERVIRLEIHEDV